MKRAMILTVLLAAAAQAGDDFETRYHQAYVLEVVEGHAPEASKAYLDLLGEKTLPAELRRRCEFRFAVTCVLLGRADEARARLAALASDPELGAPLKAEVTEYKKALESAGAGSEVDRLVQEKVLELGRESRGRADVTPAVYQDFEVLGDRARPALEKLLVHRDRKLRIHAFRLLCRLDAPDMVERWDPDWREAGSDFGEYLKRHPGAMSRIEKRLLALKPEVAATALISLRNTSFGLDFLLEMAKRPGCLPAVLRASWPHRGDPRLLDLIKRALEGPDAAAAATVYLQGWAWSEKKPDSVPDTFLPRVWKPIAELPHVSNVDPKGLERCAAASSLDVALSTLEAMVAAGEQAGLPRRKSPLFNGMADSVAAGIDKLASVDVKRYRALLDRWFAVLDLPHFSNVPFQLGAHVRKVLTGLDLQEKVPWVRKLFAGPSPDGNKRFLAAFDFKSRADLPLVEAAMQVGNRTTRGMLVGALRRALSVEKPSRQWIADLAAMLPRLVADAGKPAWEFYNIAESGLLPRCTVKQGRALVLSLVRASSTTNDQLYAIRLFSPGLTGLNRDDRVRIQKTIVLPLAAEVAGILSGKARTQLLDYLVAQTIDAKSMAIGLDDNQRKSVAAVVLHHVPDISSEKTAPRMLGAPDLYPPELWYDRIADPPPLSRGTARTVMARFVEKPGRIRPRLLAAARQRLTQAERRAAFAALLAKVEPESLSLLLGAVQEGDLGASAIRAAFSRLQGDPKSDLGALGKLAALQARFEASPVLVPVVRRLLASPVSEEAAQGIDLARRLARQELVPDLVKVLDAPDGNLRWKAKQAIEAILALIRLKPKAPGTFPRK